MEIYIDAFRPLYLSINDTFYSQSHKFSKTSCLRDPPLFHLTPSASNLTHSTLTVAATNNDPAITLLLAYPPAAATTTLFPPSLTNNPATCVPTNVPNPLTIYRTRQAAQPSSAPCVSCTCYRRVLNEARRVEVARRASARMTGRGLCVVVRVEARGAPMVMRLAVSVPTKSMLAGWACGKGPVGVVYRSW